MIIIGYPCIGKSTLAKNPFSKEFKYRVIDLESSYFKPGGKNYEGWVKSYCAVAKALSDNGHIVFVSSHKEVIDQIFQTVSVFDFCFIYPSLSLKKQWIQRALNRYRGEYLDKDLRAYERIRDHYDDDINALMKRPGFNPYHVIIEDMDYNLASLVESCLNRYKSDEYI